MVKKRRRNNNVNNKSEIIGNLIIAFFIGGILLGVILAKALNDVEKLELAGYISENLKKMKGLSIYQTDYFINNYLAQIKTVIVIWICGFFAYGFYVSYGAIALRGFMYGFTAAFLTENFGFSGFIFGLLSYIPHNIVYLPALYLLVRIGARNSRLIKKQGNVNQMPRNLMVEYILLFVVVLATFLLGALIETYVTPRLAGYFIL